VREMEPMQGAGNRRKGNSGASSDEKLFLDFIQVNNMSLRQQPLDKRDVQRREVSTTALLCGVRIVC
jgi:hypothetical protein